MSSEQITNKQSANSASGSQADLSQEELNELAEKIVKILRRELSFESERVGKII